MNGLGSFVSQLAISRIEVYNMMLREKNESARQVLQVYYDEMSTLIERFIRGLKVKLDIIGAYYIPHDTPRDYFRMLARTLEAHLVDTSIGSEIIGFVASVRQNLENVYS